MFITAVLYSDFDHERHSVDTLVMVVFIDICVVFLPLLLPLRSILSATRSTTKAVTKSRFVEMTATSAVGSQLALLLSLERQTQPIDGRTF